MILSLLNTLCPKTMKSRATALLIQLKARLYVISWDDMGRVPANGNPVPNCNILDLISDAVGWEKLFNPVSLKEFFEYYQRLICRETSYTTKVDGSKLKLTVLHTVKRKGHFGPMGRFGFSDYEPFCPTMGPKQKKKGRFGFKVRDILNLLWGQNRKKGVILATYFLRKYGYDVCYLATKRVKTVNRRWHSYLKGCFGPYLRAFFCWVVSKYPMYFCCVNLTGILCILSTFSN